MQRLPCDTFNIAMYAKDTPLDRDGFELGDTITQLQRSNDGCSDQSSRTVKQTNLSNQSESLELPVTAWSDFMHPGEISDKTGVLCGPLLNYRSIQGNTWEGSVLIVARREGKSPTEAPILTVCRLHTGDADESLCPTALAHPRIKGR